MTAVIDITRAMSAKSDQLNAEDLIAGPRVIRLRDVKVSAGEQPVAVYFDGDDGRPWKPSKTALRCLAAIWGPDAGKWIGLSCEIYNDETVTWAGAAVGGIRVSRMQGLTKPRELRLTKTRGKKAAVAIGVLEIAAATPADRWKERLLAVAQGSGDVTVEQAWSKVPDDVRVALGGDFLEQLHAIEGAAIEHRRTDDAGHVADLNAAIE